MTVKQMGFDETGKSTWIWPPERPRLVEVTPPRGDAKRTELIRGSMAEEERLGRLGLCLFQGALTTGFMFYPKGKNHFGVCIGQNSYCYSVTEPGCLLLQALS